MKHSFFLWGGGGTFPPLKTHDMKTKHNIVTPIAPTTKHQNSRTQHHKISRKKKKKSKKCCQPPTSLGHRHAHTQLRFIQIIKIWKTFNKKSIKYLYKKCNKINR